MRYYALLCVIKWNRQGSGYDRSMSIDPQLLSVLACPQDKGPLLYVPDELFYNPRLHCVYPIHDGIPVLLIDKARTVDAQEEAEILSRVKN